MGPILKKHIKPKEFRADMLLLNKCSKGALLQMVELNYRIVDTSGCSKADLVNMMLDARGWFIKVKKPAGGSFNTTRYFYPTGAEGEEMDCTFKEFDTLEKATAYCRRYAKGLRFAGCEVTSEHGELLFEITSDFEVITY